MPKRAAHKSSTKIGEFIINNLNGHSLTYVATQMGLSHSYLSEIVRGKKVPSIEICNKIADYSGTPRTQIYRLMGWFDPAKEDDFFVQLLEMAAKDPDLTELVNTYSQFQTKEDRRKAIRVLKSLLNEDLAQQ